MRKPRISGNRLRPWHKGQISSLRLLSAEGDFLHSVKAISLVSAEGKLRLTEYCLRAFLLQLKRVPFLKSPTTIKEISFDIQLITYGEVAE